MKFKAAVIMIFVCFTFALRASQWIGIYGKECKVDKKFCTSEKGVKISAVYVDSLMDISGVRPEDILIKVGKVFLDNTKVKSVAELVSYLEKEFYAGEVVEVEYLHLSEKDVYELKKIRAAIPKFTVKTKKPDKFFKEKDKAYKAYKYSAKRLFADLCVNKEKN